jgi:hypothetical protein
MSVYRVSMADKDEDEGERLATTLKMFPFMICLVVRLVFLQDIVGGGVTLSLDVTFVSNLNSVFGVFYPDQTDHYRLYNHMLPHDYMGVPLNLNNPCVQGFIHRREQIHV